MCFIATSVDDMLHGGLPSAGSGLLLLDSFNLTGIGENRFGFNIGLCVQFLIIDCRILDKYKLKIKQDA